MKQLLSKLGVWTFALDALPAYDAAEAAQRIEKLGYNVLWIPEATGRDPFCHASWLLANTNKLILATGIANIYHREPGTAMAAQQTLTEQANGRFLLGLGVSHKPLVEGLRQLRYGPPVATMRNYLERMKQSPYSAVKPRSEPATVIAALGPRMLELAASHCDGAHPYFTSPEHTAMARKIMGPDSLLCVEQKVIMETDPDKARAVARAAAKLYIQLLNYRNNWKRMGLTDNDFEQGGSDRFIDTTFAWGNVAAIRNRIQQHMDAGASHVCIQPLNPTGDPMRLHWAALEALAP